jgi:hypothetical protein
MIDCNLITMEMVKEKTPQNFNKLCVFNERMAERAIQWDEKKVNALCGHMKHHDCRDQSLQIVLKRARSYSQDAKKSSDTALITYFYQALDMADRAAVKNLHLAACLKGGYELELEKIRQDIFELWG